VFGVEHALGLAAQMSQLRAFVHVSTAFANTNLVTAGDVIEERVYDHQGVGGMDFGKLVKALRETPRDVLDRESVTKVHAAAIAILFWFQLVVGSTVAFLHLGLFYIYLCCIVHFKQKINMIRLLQTVP
jgi:hypothetical protein